MNFDECAVVHPHHNTSDRTPAYVLWLGPTGLNIVRSLGRHGVPVVALHDNAAEPATGTRYARVRILPSLAEHEDAWLSFLLDEGRRLAPRKAVLLVASDATWLLVAKHRSALSAFFLFPLPDAENPCDWPNKGFQQDAAARAGILLPASLPARDRQDLEYASRRARFPCLLKPAMSHLWQRRYPRKLDFVRSPAELIQRGTEALAEGFEFTVQEYIPAEDHDVYCVHCYLDRQSRPLAACVARKVRQCEPRFGTSSMSMSVHEPRALGLAMRLLRSMGFHGIASVEFKRDPRDDQFKLMEVNVRAPLMLAVSIDSGVDVPYIAYRDLIGDPLPVQTEPRRLGRRVGDFARDIHAARYYRQVGWLSTLGWLKSWRRARDMHFAWDDLGPFRGYLHMLHDHWRRGKFKTLPDNFPTPEQWQAGTWMGDAQAQEPQTPLSCETTMAA